MGDEESGLERLMKPPFMLANLTSCNPDREALRQKPKERQTDREGDGREG